MNLLVFENDQERKDWMRFAFGVTTEVKPWLTI